MSSTKRGAVRLANDAYFTPRWCVDAILPYLPEPKRVFDPSVGSCVLLELAQARWPNAELCGVDLAIVNELPGAMLAIGNFFAMGKDHPIVAGADLWLLNPPYTIALEFIDRCLSLKREDATVTALLRLNFLGGRKRRDWHQAHPADVYVLSKRPSFTNGGTDSCEYAWFVWGPETSARIAVL